MSPLRMNNKDFSATPNTGAGYTTQNNNTTKGKDETNNSRGR